MQHLDLITIVIFSIVVVVCGMSFSGSGKSMKSFFAGGGALPWWLSGLSLFMGFFSAGTFVVWGAIAYRYGWVAVVIQWTMCIAGFAVGFIFAPKWQKTGVLTAAEFITQRLGYHTQKIYSYLFLLISIFTTGAFLYPVARILQVYTGIPIYITTIVIGLLILIYTTIGGLWAVVITDVLQFIILTAAVLIVVPLAFEKVGGISSFIQKAPPHFFNFYNHEYSLGFLIAFGFYNMFFLGGNWAYVQRYTSVKDKKSAKKVGWLFGALYIISPIIWMLPPMIYKVINPHLSGLENEGAYLLMCKEVLPTGVMGLILGGMVFSTSSAVNTTLNISAGVFTNDIFKHFYPDSSEKKLIMVARWTTIILGLLTIGMALMVPLMGGDVNVVLSIAALTGGALYLPPLWALFSKRQTGISVLSITILSLIINLFFKFVSPKLFNLSLSRSVEMVVGMGVPIVLLSLYEFLFSMSRPFSMDYKRYELLMAGKGQIKVSSEAEGNESNVKGKRVLSKGVLSIGILICILGIYSFETTWLVLVMGATILVVGILLYHTKKGNKNSIKIEEPIVYVDKK
jgi:SSS family transporter